MNSKAEKTQSLNPADIAKLVLAVAVLGATVYGYYYFGDAPGSLRFVGVLAGVLISLAIAAFTTPGAQARGFIGEAQFEMRKVVWPTREDTVRTTIMIIIVTVIIAALLGLIDVFLRWAILDTLLKLG